MVAAKLGAAVGVRECDAADCVRETPREVVHTADGRDHPKIVADARLSVGTEVSFEGARGLDFERLEIGLVGVFEESGEVGRQIVRVDVFAGLDPDFCVPDGHAVLDHVFARRNGADGVLVAVVSDLHVVERMDDHGCFVTPCSTAAAKPGMAFRSMPQKSALPRIVFTSGFEAKNALTSGASLISQER